MTKKTNNTSEIIQSLLGIGEKLPEEDFGCFAENLNLLTSQLASYERKLLTLSDRVKDARFSRKAVFITF